MRLGTVVFPRLVFRPPPLLCLTVVVGVTLPVLVARGVILLHVYRHAYKYVGCKSKYCCHHVYSPDGERGDAPDSTGECGREADLVLVTLPADYKTRPGTGGGNTVGAADEDTSWQCYPEQLVDHHVHRSCAGCDRISEAYDTVDEEFKHVEVSSSLGPQLKSLCRHLRPRVRDLEVSTLLQPLKRLVPGAVTPLAAMNYSDHASDENNAACVAACAE